jgi:hypothetical protein
VSSSRERDLLGLPKPPCNTLAGAAEPPANDNAAEVVHHLAIEPPLTTSERRSRAAQQRRDARFAEMLRRREQGMTLRAIAQTLELGHKTVGIVKLSRIASRSQ